MPVDYKRLRANADASVVTPWIGPSGATSTLGVEEVGEPTAAELNNTGDVSGLVMAAKAISWDDWDFGTSASETNSQPSMADVSTYEEFGQYNFGGGISFFQPLENDDPSNVMSVVKDLTKVDLDQDIVTRIDGDKPVTQAAANGDYVSVYRTTSVAVANPFTPGESKRRTVTFSSAEDFAYYTVVGPHVLTAVETGNTYAVGEKRRIRIEVQGRDFTNSDALRWSSSDAGVIDIYPGGFYEIVGAGTATVTVEDTEAGTSVEIEIEASSGGGGGE